MLFWQTLFFSAFALCMVFLIINARRSDKAGLKWVILGVLFLASFLALLRIDVSDETAPDIDSPDLSVYLSNGEDAYWSHRHNMLQNHLIARGIADPQVLRAMGHVKRHLFVQEHQQDSAYNDHPLPIGEGQTISQPYVVALMTEILDLSPGDRVLEIGSGSGYQAAVMAEITDEIFSIEIKESLTDFARNNLRRAGYDKVMVKHGDGYFGWEEHAPFDAIIITCAANHIPPPLILQLKDGGRLVLPLGDVTYYQTLTLISKNGEDLVVDHITDVAFVPMTGEALN